MERDWKKFAFMLILDKQLESGVELDDIIGRYAYDFTKEEMKEYKEWEKELNGEDNESNVIDGTELSPSTLRILREIENSTEGWHTSIEATDDEISLFEDEFGDSGLILEVNQEGKNEWYIILGTDFTKSTIKEID